ncbi:formate dehydrogenase accessory sulfurtransferase FdhD [Laribacter hongkongensis]|uniref:formate dehydrogenase accessory sulfurtransferase FdhD n=1 Tax=Laribacter hongkongensis TaxID=168471 RepID=UPI0003F9A29C|nr:formate dehydrogenase accessory sulfurtransferase FdhD [Laribacter hongkongensis]
MQNFPFSGCPVPVAGEVSMAPAQRLDVVRLRDGLLVDEQDTVAAEVPVALVFNGISHAVMMCTPEDLEDFATGFSLSEGIVPDLTALYDIEVVPVVSGIEVRIELAAGCFSALKDRRRQLSGRTGCGLCGVESLQQAIRPVRPVPRQLKISQGALQAAMAGLPACQVLARETGATHAAAWCTPDGQILAVREDVGRHVALDKLIGMRARQGWSDGFVIVTSRASYEMVHKVAEVGVELLAAISAPTALAVDLAHAAGLTLAGFVRGERAVVYAGAGRLVTG